MPTKTVAGGVSTFAPSPEQIRRSCKLIQQSWTDASLRKKLGLDTRRPDGVDTGWVPPRVHLALEATSRQGNDV